MKLTYVSLNFSDANNQVSSQSYDPGLINFISISQTSLKVGEANTYSLSFSITSNL